MTVQQLIDELSKLPADAQIYVYDANMDDTDDPIIKLSEYRDGSYWIR